MKKPPPQSELQKHLRQEIRKLEEELRATGLLPEARPGSHPFLEVFARAAADIVTWHGPKHIAPFNSVLREARNGGEPMPPFQIPPKDEAARREVLAWFKKLRASPETYRLLRATGVATSEKLLDAFAHATADTVVRKGRAFMPEFFNAFRQHLAENRTRGWKLDIE